MGGSLLGRIISRTAGVGPPALGEILYRTLACMIPEIAPVIEGAELLLIPLRLRHPFRSSRGTVHERPVILVALHGDGVTGWGECVALAVRGYAPETAESAWSVLSGRLLPALLRGEPERSWMRDVPMASAAIEMAAWDLAAKRAGRPLCEMLGGSVRPVPAGVSFGFEDDRDALLRRVEQCLVEGYHRIKLKIEPGRDLETLTHVRARFPEAVLSADANGGYRLVDLVRLRELDNLGLAMLEQPLEREDLRGHAILQEALRTPICLDESIRSVKDARLAIAMGSARVINLKPGRVGGFGQALQIHDLCRAGNVPLWCGGMLESGVGRAHNVALATLPGFNVPGDLSASRRYWERDLVQPEWELAAGALTPVEAPGIGIELDRGYIKALATRCETFP